MKKRIFLVLAISLGAAGAAQVPGDLPNPGKNGNLLPITAVLAATTSDWPSSPAVPPNPGSSMGAMVATYWTNAKAGDVSAQVQLGQALADGIAGRLDYAQAAYWDLQAMQADPTAGKNYYRAEAAYGKLLLLGRGVPLDATHGLALAADAAAHGDPNGMTMEGMAAMFGWGTPQNYGTARTWLLNAMNAGNAGSAAFAHTLLATLYLEGWGLAQDYQQALQLYTEAAAGGDADAEVKLGEMSMYGLGGARNYTQAAAWFQKAANRPNPLGVEGLAELYSRGWGVARSYPQAYDYYKRAADAGLPLAESEVAIYNLFGLGIPYDSTAAATYGERAADHGDGLVQPYLADIRAGIRPRGNGH